MNTIILSGRETLVTRRPDAAYRVVTGRVNVFVTVLEQDAPGRRIFLTEAGHDAVIPALACEKDLMDGAGSRAFRFLIAPIRAAELEETQADEADRIAFCRLARVEDCENLGFDDAVAEHYQLELARDMRNIYAAGQENTAAKKRTALGIFDLFRVGGRRNYRPEQTQSALYNAVASVCAWMNIGCAPWKTVTAACGRNFDVYDIARISGYACREILLTENWYRQDIGPVLAFCENRKKPVACIPKNNRSYLVYFGESGESRKLDREEAARILPQAYMFYRPFPREKMNLKKLARFGLRDVRGSDLRSILLFAVLGLLIGLLIPYLNEQVYDLFVPIGDAAGLQGVGAVIIACTTGSLSFSLVQGLCSFHCSNRIKYALQAASVDRLFNLPQSFLRQYDSADLARRVMSIPEIFAIIADGVLNYGLNMLLSLCYLFRIFSFDRNIAWAAILMLTVTAGAVLLIGDRQIRYERVRYELENENASLLYQLFAGVDRLRLSHAEERGIARYMQGFTKQCSMNFKSEKHQYAVTIISTAAGTVFSIVFYFLVVRNMESVSVGKFMGFTAAFGALSGAVMQTVQQWLTVNNVVPFYEKAKPILQELPEKEEEVVIPTDIRGEVEVSNLTFGYDPEGEPILKGISFCLQPGEYVGIVGGSGSGKSTLMKLLLGFEKPQEGRIYYDGQDLESVDKRELRKKFGVVLQDGGIISGSIYDNVTIAKPNARLKEVKEAIRDAGLESDIKEMPMGLNTVLSEGSGGVSGGQKQRILIARAIVGKPKVLFFDEATSALDNNIQAQVCESLEKLNATRIVIAHRLSTVMHCDRIFVLDHGVIAEEGTYQQLMEKKGIFYGFALRQLT